MTEQFETAEPESAPETETEINFIEEIKPPTDEGKSFPTFDTMQNFELDDFDLLELPQSKKFNNENPSIAAEKPNFADISTPTGSLSPEEIEAVADKVVEKLSDKVIKRIVREVFRANDEKEINPTVSSQQLAVSSYLFIGSC